MRFAKPLCTLVAATALLLGTALAGASAAPALAGLVEVGSGELRWFGMEVYEARLLSSDGRFDGDLRSGPIALEIVYRRNFSRASLVRTTGREWQRLRRELGLGTPDQVERWLAEVGEIWPDVAPGDRIIALVEPAGRTEFLGNDGPLGAIEDPEFGPAFLGIWLHPDTRAADLRAELIGAPQ
jgi:hypothetical protein